MSYVFKVSKTGCDVNDENVKPSDDQKKTKETIHMLYLLASPYLLGAKLQLIRYREEARKLNKQRAAIGIMACLHESSCLFEDIVTVLTYLRKCGLSHRMDLLLIDIRNHIRHDIRDNFDEEEDGRKKPRLKRLGIKANLQTDLEFSFEFIKVGNKIIYLKDIDSYIAWAESNINKVLIDARERGLLKEE